MSILLVSMELRRTHIQERRTLTAMMPVVTTTFRYRDHLIKLEEVGEVSIRMKIKGYSKLLKDILLTILRQEIQSWSKS
jgi:hypothetical protein